MIRNDAKEIDPDNFFFWVLLPYLELHPVDVLEFSENSIDRLNTFVIENIMSVALPGVLPSYYGTPRGAGIGLVLEFPGGAKWAIEIKRSSAPTVSRGFYSGCEDIKPDKRFVVYSGKDRFPVKEDVTAISLPGLMEELLMQN